jgi:hypothetical protein
MHPESITKVNYRLINGHDWPVVNSKTKKVNTFTPPDLGETSSLPIFFASFMRRFPQFSPLLDSIFDDLLLSPRCRPVINLSLELVWQIVLGNIGILKLMGILIALAITKIFH